VKQTTANNIILRNVKAVMNQPIFVKASKLANEEGDAAVLKFLAAFTSSPGFFQENHGRDADVIRDKYLDLTRV
jgi:hypothetical protein